MKKRHDLIIILSLLGFAGCKANYSSDIEGTYVNAYQQEFAKGNDTLIITPYNRTANTYKIERHTGYNRVEQGKLLPRKFQQEEWMATFDADKMVLQQTAFGRQVYIDILSGTVSFGGTYRKIK